VSFGLEAYAYLGIFNPASLCTNYAGSANTQITGLVTYNFTVAAGQTFIVEAEEYIANTFCASYTVTVGNCATGRP
jgi:hypothetical protein